MALAADSYASVGEVAALVRHLLDGNVSFTYDTRPNVTEVENFINYASGILNSALAKYGFTTPVTQATVLYALDGWVASKAAAWCEATERGAGYSDEGNQRVAVMAGLVGDAAEFVDMMAQGWIELGAGYSSNVGAGLTFTAMDKNSERSDPDNTSREQPLFSRRQFDRGGPA